MHPLRPRPAYIVNVVLEAVIVLRLMFENKLGDSQHKTTPGGR